MRKRFKKIISLCLLLSMLISTVNVEMAFAESSSFLDTRNHWAENAIERWTSREILSGYEDGSFKPSSQITRAEFLAIVNRLFGFKKESNTQFTDVMPNAWYSGELLKAREAGYFEGFGENMARPDEKLNRQESATMLAKVFELELQENKTSKFKDMTNISDDIGRAVDALVNIGAISGYPDGTFKPNNTITRAEIIAIIDKMVKGYFNVSGTYTGSIKGITLVTAPNVVLKDASFDGDLYLTAGIGEGSVTLENTTVEGTTFIGGGGESGTKLINSKLSKITINKVDAGVVAEKGTTIDSINVLAKANINIKEGSSVSSLNIQAGAKGTQVLGKDRIDKFAINADGVKVDGKEVKKGTDPKVDSAPPPPISGGGSSGGDSGGSTPVDNGKRTVTFNLNGASGTTPATQTVNKGSKVTMPTEPKWIGHIFAGWYTSPKGEQYEAFNTGGNIDSNMTLYAQWIEEDHVSYITTTSGGKTEKLGYSTYSDVEIRKMSDNSIVPVADLKSGKVNYGVYKDLNGNGKLDVYEDWTKGVDARTADLAAQMSYKEIAGLMLYSSHQRTWGSSVPTQAQITFLANDDLRHVLIAGEIPAKIAAPWNNNVQAMSEKFGLGIPANNSSDPRHSAAIGVEYYSGNTGAISLWPNSLGLAATFDPDVMLEFGKIASAEYRALGISTALSPQIDLSTDPRWSRLNGTFGEDPKLAADMTEGYVQGFQGTFDGSRLIGWGSDSVNAMIKHWPGGGGGEGGRDAHNDYGKYSVYPGNNFDAHTVPFVDGALQGNADNTTMATAVMPYYTISYNVDPSGEEVANAFSEYIITDLLRNKYEFDGVICTDWGVDATRGWGPDLETLSISERSKLLIEAGVDQFGGRNTSIYILEAVELAKAEGTESNFRNKMEESASRLLKNVFRTGLFENPYLDEAKSVATVASDEFIAKGHEAQVKSIVMMKNNEMENNKGVLPLANDTKVYVPKDSKGEYLVKGADNYFDLVDDPDEADVAIVSLGSPLPASGSFGGGWSAASGYTPLTLQYSEYTAVNGRGVSIAGDYRNIADNSSKILNRSYKNRTNTPTNLSELQVLLSTKEEMGTKPVIAVVNMSHPMVFTEVDYAADAIVARFASSDNAVLDILSGNKEPSGLLPVQMPKNMAAVEAQLEDVPRDMEVYQDSNGNEYDFAFGLNWKGVINDERVAKYKVEPLMVPESGSSTTNDYVTVTTHALPIGKTGASYNAEIKTKEANASFTLVSGNLPAGLNFNNGIISGTPTGKTHEYGNQLTVRATATGKQDRIFRITLVVNDTGIVDLADPNELSIILTLASAKLEKNYESDTWIEFSDAYDSSKAVYAAAKTSPSTQEEIDEAVRGLKTAMNSLVRIGTVVDNKVAAPIASVEGDYTTGQGITLTLTSETEDAKIYYTLDGSTPDTSGTLYEGPITISKTTTVQAIAVKEGMEDSEVVILEYIIGVEGETEMEEIDEPEGSEN